ncbi:MAG: HAMP domain-containing histidine kinase [Clostridia bacterium]|nr:HAMP domain-containing histidine kinase [Clostridia bacterium]
MSSLSIKNIDIGIFPCVLIAVLLVIIAILLIKIHLLRKSAKEITDAFSDRLTTDTNTLISISCRDKYMRQLANNINLQLRMLRRERQRFQQGDAELKIAVTNISHDLRTPLTAICGYLDLLEQEEKSAEVSRYLEVIQNRTEMLKELTEELFRYSIIVSTDTNSANDRNIDETVILNNVLEESIAAYYASLKAHDIIPDIHIPDPKIVCTLNCASLSRVFSNLLNNAVKYSDGDLQITLSETGTITFSNKASRLNEVQVGKLFDRFYTVESARNSTGLGLTIARTLLEEMGGTINARYESGRLIVMVSVPIAINATAKSNSCTNYGKTP